MALARHPVEPSLAIAAAARLEVAVEKSLRAPTAADSFHLRVAFAAEARITILFGRSGAGKSTLLDLIAGILSPDSGRIALANSQRCGVFFDSDSRLTLPPAQRKIGYVFQGLALFPHLTVSQNVEFGLRSLSRDERAVRSHAVLQLFHIDQLRDRKPADISGGERQRVALARTLITEPRALLLDEPLNALDAATKNQIIEDLVRWNTSRNIPVIYVTHSRTEALRLGERMLLLDHGSLVAEGEPRELLRGEQFED